MFPLCLHPSSHVLIQYVWAIKGCSFLGTGVSPLGRILVGWAVYSHFPMSRKECDVYSNTAGPMCILDYGKQWPTNGSLNCYALMKLELYCQWLEKSDEILYV